MNCGPAAAEQDGKGFCGKANSQMEHGGQDLVGEGEPGWTASSGAGLRVMKHTQCGSKGAQRININAVAFGGWVVRQAGDQRERDPW